MMKSYWRKIAKPIIQKVLQDTKGMTEKEIRKALREAYPWGIRNLHPYKIWCDEIRQQRGMNLKKEPINANQQTLF